MQSIVPFGSALLLTIAIHFFATVDAWVSWLVALNLMTMLTYGYDKRIAGSPKRRVPEITLLGLALCGGSPAAIIAMQVFRHKTVKSRFRRKFWLVVVFQLGILLLIWAR